MRFSWVQDRIEIDPPYLDYLMEKIVIGRDA